MIVKVTLEHLKHLNREMPMTCCYYIINWCGARTQSFAIHDMTYPLIFYSNSWDDLYPYLISDKQRNTTVIENLIKETQDEDKTEDMFLLGPCVTADTHREQTWRRRKQRRRQQK